MTIRTSEQLEDYQSFYDHDWMRTLVDLTDNTMLEKPVFELAASWKGTSNARRLPWLMMMCLKEYYESMANSYEPTPLSVISTLIDRVDKRIEKHSLSFISSDRQALVKEFQDIESELVQGLQQNRITYNLQTLWQEFISAEEFIISLWMSEVQAYSSVYFAYEIFLISSVKLLTNQNRLRTHQLEITLQELTGSNTLWEFCWNHEVVEKARLVRSAIVHNGRKITSDLENYRGELALEEDEIVIMPQDTNQLYGELKDRVSCFCEAFIR